MTGEWFAKSFKFGVDTQHDIGRASPHLATLEAQNFPKRHDLRTCQRIHGRSGQCIIRIAIGSLISVHPGLLRVRLPIDTCRARGSPTALQAKE